MNTAYSIHIEYVRFQSQIFVFQKTFLEYGGEEESPVSKLVI